MFCGKSIIGIAGGIGSGKSFVARIFAEAGCRVIDSDGQVRAAYQQDAVRQTLRDWWGPGVFKPEGGVDRAAVARKVFADPGERDRLERLLHPLVNAARVREMEESANDEKVVAFVWDTPLLFETGLNQSCDVVVFVEATEDQRRSRVLASRGWPPEEHSRRENLQWPLDKKHRMSEYTVKNTPDADDDVRRQVSEVLSQILARVSPASGI